MSSDYTGDPSEFFETLSLMTGGDRRTAQSVRTPLERLLDNACFLRASVDTSAAGAVFDLRDTDAAFTDTAERLAATCLVAEDGAPGPVVALKTGEALAVYGQETQTLPGGAVPNLTSIVAAAVSTAGRVVVVGATTPFCAFRDAGGSWTGGGNQIGGTPGGLVYSPAYDGFLAPRGVNVYRSTNAASWAATDVGLGTTILHVAVIGAGAGEGVIVALSTATAPTIKRSLDDGATYVTAGVIPNRLTADEAGCLAGCPMVSRLNLNQYAYHCSRNDSGARLRTARSADGATWESGVTIEAPTGYTFDSFPTLRICQSTGLMVIAVPATHTADSTAVTLLYTSRDFQRWVGPDVRDQVDSNAFAVAGGRLLLSPDASLLASAGVIYKVHS
jgi:hypothetical protein